jgi:hypothetical protein
MNTLCCRIFSIIGLNLNTLFQKLFKFISSDSFVHFRHEFRFSFFQYKNSYFSEFGITYKIEMIESHLIKKMNPSSEEHLNF